MDRWSRTTILFAGCETIERALDYIADKNGFDKFTFEPSLAGPPASKRSLYSKPEAATTWLIALRAKSDTVTLIKCLPLTLMTASLSPMRTRPVIATMCALLSCCGVYYSFEDDVSFCIAANNQGDCQISGLTFEEENSLWVPTLELKSDGQPEVESTEVNSAFQRHGFRFISNYGAGRDFLIDFAKLSDADLSDGVIHELIDTGRSPDDWIVLEYKQRESAI